MSIRFSFLFFYIFLLATTIVSAQVEFGIKAGLSTQSLQGQDLQLNSNSASNLLLSLEDAEYGIQAGIFFRFPLSEKVFLQPEITFNSTTANFRLNDPNQNEAFVFEERYNDINVPLLLGYKLGFLRLQAGPVGHFYLESMSDLGSQEGWNEVFDSFNLGYALGGAIDIGQFTIDLRFDGNFSRFGQTFTFLGDEFTVDQAPRRWIATVGYRL